MKLLVEATPGFPKHVYWLSNDSRTCYGYIKQGSDVLLTFKKPMKFDPRGRDLRKVTNA